MLIGAAIMSILGQFLAFKFLPSQSASQLHIQMPFRIFDFVCGMIPAVLLVKGEKRFTGIAWIVGLFGLFGAPYIRSAFFPDYSYQWVDMFFAPTWGCLIYASLASPQTILAKILSLKPITYIGVISYSMYLYNVLMDKIPFWILPNLEKGTLTWWIIALPSVIIGGALGYYLIEKPSIILRNRFETHNSIKEPKSRSVMQRSLLLSRHYLTLK
jgi:peptidoglycan/LPS O-acetylase OafA/YrhL